MKGNKEIKIPVRIVKINRMKPFLKKAGSFVLLFTIISSQVFLLSAFEAHVVNVTAHICKPSETRTMGYWKNHSEVYINCLPKTLGDEIVNSTTTVSEVFINANADIMRDMLKAQLLAMKFNICVFGIDSSEGEEFGGYILNELIIEADNLLRDPNSTREKQELVKDLLDHANNLHQIKYCSTPPFWPNASFAKKADIEEPTAEELTASLQTILTEEPPAEESPLELGPAPCCGDGIIDEGEQCDTGENNGVECIPEYSSPCDYCSLTCETNTITGPYCGDGITNGNEECDDGNVEDGDGCSVSCTLEGVAAPATECEPDAQQVCSTGLWGICEAGTQTCSSEGFWGDCLQDEEPVAEVCDDGLDNDCNGLTDCDDESCFQNPACQEPEPAPYCGDGNLDDGEECDDGNKEDGDGCSTNCATEEVLPPVTECEPDAQQVCSTGLLGICEAGTQTCSSESFWGDCLQDNQPTDEACSNGLDDNCDGNVDCDDTSCAEDVSCLPPAPEEPPVE